MQALPPDRQTDLRAYWLIHHGEDMTRAMLSTPAGLADLYNVLAASRGIDPAKERAKQEQEQEALIRRIAAHSGVSVDKVKGGMG